MICTLLLQNVCICTRFCTLKSKSLYVYLFEWPPSPYRPTYVVGKQRILENENHISNVAHDTLSVSRNSDWSSLFISASNVIECNGFSILSSLLSFLYEQTCSVVEFDCYLLLCTLTLCYDPMKMGSAFYTFIWLNVLLFCTCLLNSKTEDS